MGQSFTHPRGKVVSLVKLEDLVMNTHRMDYLARRFTHGAIRQMKITVRQFSKKSRHGTTLFVPWRLSLIRIS